MRSALAKPAVEGRRVSTPGLLVLGCLPLLVQAALTINPELNRGEQPQLDRQELAEELMIRASLLEQVWSTNLHHLAVDGRTHPDRG